MNNFIKNHLNEIKKLNFSNPELELRTLLNHSSLNNKEIFLNNFDIEKIDVKKFNSAFVRKMNYEPISKIFNNKEFWSLDFHVNQFVLDPRPESEFLIQTIQKYFTNFHSKIKICDLGTGSGCLAITLAKIYKKSKILATDISKKALAVAKKNAIKHNEANQIQFNNDNWISKNTKFDLVVSNPPYLSFNQYNNCEKNVKEFEPKIALVGGHDGLKSYRQIAKIANSLIHNNSFIFLK